MFLRPHLRNGCLPWGAAESSSAIFFGAFAIAAFTVTPAPFGNYGTVAADAWLALVTWGSLAIRRPFTLGIAKTTVPAQFHGNPFFYRTNAIIIAVWSTAFTLEALLFALLLNVAPHATAALIVIKVCAFAIPITFTVRYSRIVRARQEANR